MKVGKKSEGGMFILNARGGLIYQPESGSERVATEDEKKWFLGLFRKWILERISNIAFEMATESFPKDSDVRGRTLAEVSEEIRVLSEALYNLANDEPGKAVGKLRKSLAARTVDGILLDR